MSQLLPTLRSRDTFNRYGQRYVAGPTTWKAFSLSFQFANLQQGDTQTPAAPMTPTLLHCLSTEELERTIVVFPTEDQATALRQLHGAAAGRIRAGITESAQTHGWPLQTAILLHTDQYMWLHQHGFALLFEPTTDQAGISLHLQQLLDPRHNTWGPLIPARPGITRRQPAPFRAERATHTQDNPDQHPHLLPQQSTNRG